MAVPETPVHKDDFLPTREDDVGTPRQVSNVESKSVSSAVQEASKPNLRLRILRANFCHVSTALFGAHEVCHSISLWLPSTGQVKRIVLRQLAAPKTEQALALASGKVPER